jgi:hypothetical protein
MVLSAVTGGDPVTPVEAVMRDVSGAAIPAAGAGARLAHVAKTSLLSVPVTVPVPVTRALSPAASAASIAGGGTSRRSAAFTVRRAARAVTPPTLPSLTIHQLVGLVRVR